MVINAIESVFGSEIFVPKIPSYRVVDLARALNESARLEIVGIRPGEKIHEQMIGGDDRHSTFEYSDYYKILPMINEWGIDNYRIKKGKKVPEGFIYSSDNNKEWMTKSDLKKWIDMNKNYVGSY